MSGYIATLAEIEKTIEKAQTLADLSDDATQLSEAINELKATTNRF